ncbi:polysaccharide deacetylase family protein [Chitinimonas sp. BJYL2]|uniref:polysaccharide deacetylase family protein n=1 Tax=Chitinimonas sp. BJYL2 TaxID=2976696 RepID=UPI0022B5CADB|nr:polysaccharide deacetylase family protein [Chitinimonas sp. BJYL2]
MPIYGFLSALLVATTAQADTAPAFAWPNGAKAAVSLSYDDATNTQLDHAIPTLDRYGIKATFYLTLSSPTVRERMTDWRAAAARGHELGNHTLFHQCARSQPNRNWVQPHHDLDRISAAQLRDEIRVGNTMLTAIDGQTERTFTAPCAEDKAGGEDYLPLIEPEFVGMKTAIGGVTPSMTTLNRYRVGSMGPEGLSAAEMIAIVREAARKGTMASLTFHGVGGDYLSVSREAHEGLVRYLAEHKTIYWTDTFVNIMRHVRQQSLTTAKPVVAAHPAKTSR